MLNLTKLRFFSVSNAKEGQQEKLQKTRKYSWLFFLLLLLHYSEKLHLFTRIPMDALNKV